MMTPQHERWAEALAVKRRYGGETAAFVAERIGALALADDDAGVIRWREIAACLEQLDPGTIQ